MSSPFDDPRSDQPQPQTQPSATPSRTAVLDREEQVREETQAGDHERFAHYVQKHKIMESAVSGEPVIALCGKVWVPGRDPKKFPVCPTCKEIYEGIQGGGGDDSRS
ncbi:DUF3039 domain-containing protein [Kineococcus gynurae]|uniref:DUF3039 domain-containing protein n=1 Tax=Kineococcus gynurae TaxID=452979 RepID=A0ABV5LX51_9ACTN